MNEQRVYFGLYKYFLWPVGGEHTASAASGQQQLTLLLHIFARLSDFFHIYWEIIKIVLS